LNEVETWLKSIWYKTIKNLKGFNKYISRTYLNVYIGNSKIGINILRLSFDKTNK